MKMLRVISIPGRNILYKKGSQLVFFLGFLYRLPCIFVGPDNGTVLDHHELLIMFFYDFSLVFSIVIKFFLKRVFHG